MEWLDNIKGALGLLKVPWKIRTHPAFLTSMAASADAFDKLSLKQYMKPADKDRHSQHLFGIVVSTLQASNQIAACRAQFVPVVEDFARWQVLLIPPEPEPDVTGLRGMPGVTGELRSHLLAIAGKDPEVHQAVMADRAATDAQDVQAFVEARYQNCWWYLRTLDALRIGLDDWDRDQDWSRPFSHAMCAWSEQQFRMMLDLPSALPGEPPVAAMMYWTLRDAVLAGERNPVHHWQEHYRDAIERGLVKAYF
jgi:hypothetical protein